MAEKNEVRIIILSAMLSAVYDIMGKDGKNSILRFAGLDDYIDREVNPSVEESIPFDIFKKFIDSMQSLLGHGTNAILFESGRKFAVYLSPFGYSLEEVVKKLQEWLGGRWEVQKGTDENTTLVRVRDNPICRDVESTSPYCHIISGALSRIREEATGEKSLAEEIHCIAMGHETCDFVIGSLDSAKKRKES